MDLTGRFPKRSSRGNEHVLAGCYYDGNDAHRMTVKNRKGPTIAKVWRQLNTLLNKSEIDLEARVLNNEISKQSMEAFENESTTCQLFCPCKSL